MTQTSVLCSQETLDALIARLQTDGGVEDIDVVLDRHPDDARLHFLQGSVLAGDRRYDEAIAAITRAVKLQADYDIARFQLGFLQFTSGDPAAASATWAPLPQAADRDPFRLFAEGLMHLAADEVPAALDKLDRGLLANRDNASLNRDIGLLVAELRRQGLAPQEPTSETDLLLRQFGLGSKY